MHFPYRAVGSMQYGPQLIWLEYNYVLTRLRGLSGETSRLVTAKSVNSWSLYYQGRFTALASWSAKHTVIYAESRSG